MTCDAHPHFLDLFLGDEFFTCGDDVLPDGPPLATRHSYQYNDLVTRINEAISFVAEIEHQSSAAVAMMA